jgi:hypothetical protein
MSATAIIDSETKRRKKLVRAGRLGEFFSIPDDRGLPILTNSDQYPRVFKAPGSAASLSPNFYSKRRVL